MSAWRWGMRAIGGILWVMTMSAQAQTIDANCRQFAATGNMNCTLSPASFSSWAYYTGYASGATEEEAIQNTLSAYFGSGSSACDVTYFTDAQTVLTYDGFANSNQAINTRRKFSVQSGTLSNGVCQNVQIGAIFTITGIRTADCKVGWSKYWDSPRATNFCGIYSAPLPAESSSELSCRSPWANAGVDGASDGEAVGNPILPATGEKLQSETDFADGGPAPLSFVRTYRSNWANSSAITHDATSLGTAWSHNHAIRLSVTTGAIGLVTITTGEGYLRFFKRASDGASWQATNSVDTLVVTASGGWTYRRSDDDATLNFNAAGLLQTLVARSGWTVTYLYNGAGQLASVSNALGRTLNFAYNAAGQLQSLATPDGRTVSYSYDASGRLVTVTAPDATTRTYLYENTSFPQALTGIADEVGARFATFAYNSLGQAISSEHAGSAVYQVNYPSATTASVTDPLGTVRSYTYSTTANRLNVVSASSAASTDMRDAVSRTVDSNGLVTTETDFKYNPMRSVTWDTTRRLPLTVVRAPNATEAQGTTIQWHATLALPVLVTESGRTTAWTYDASGNALSQTITDTATGKTQLWQWTYSAQGLVATETAPNGATTSYTYDALGNLVQATNALGQATSYSYDGANRLVSASDPNGLLTTYTYDARDRLLTRTVGGQQTTTLSYNATGTLATLSLPNGLAFSYVYDAAHRLTGWSNNRGESGIYTLDGMGNRTAEQVKDSGGNVAWTSARTINALNRVSARTDGPNQTSSFGYDRNGDLVTQTNGLSQSTQYSLDVLRRVKSITNAASAGASLTYNAQDAVTAASDFKGVVTSYTRDGQGNATAESSADTGVSSTQYDNLGLPSQVTDALGQATTITRDALGRPTGLVFADGKTTTLRYDLTANSKGYLSEIIDRSGTIEYTRDAFGRINLKKQTLANGSVQQVSYAYNPNGTLASIGYPNGGTLSHVYDATGRLTGLNWNGNPLVSGIAWNPLGQPTAWTWAFTTGSPQLAASRSYDTAGRLTGTEFSSYGYDAAGRITSLTQNLNLPGDTDPTHSTIANANVTWSVGYNSVGRITSFNATGNTSGFGYDANGNRSSSTRVLNGQTTNRTYTAGSSTNRLTGFTQTINGASSASVTYGYNANGDLVSDGLRSYGYDAEQRLSNATTGATDTSPTTRYAHNALGQRVFKTEPLYPATQGDESDSGFMASLIAFFRQLWSPSTATAEQLGYAYTYDEGGTLIAEAGSGGTASTGEAQYIYLPTASGPMPIAAVINGTTYAVHSDHLNTPRKLTNVDGQAVWQWGYSAFGEDKPTVAKYRFANLDTTPNPGTTGISEVKFNLRYPGQYADDESGLFYNSFRTYIPALGRYTQGDPIGLDGGWNRFGYVSGNPLGDSDALGLMGDGKLVYPEPTVMPMFGGRRSSGEGPQIAPIPLAGGGGRGGLSGTARGNVSRSGGVASGLPRGGAMPPPCPPGGLPGPQKMVDHHLMPQQFRKFFEARGIDIDSHTISIGDLSHSRGVHGRGLGNMPGRWNQTWRDWINANPNANDADIYRQLGRMMDDYNLQGIPIHSYRK